jgi:dissimilatory sulfite reductase related protein
MNTRLLAGREVHVDEEGFMSDPAEWDRDVAAALATEEGIPALTDAHWFVLDWARNAASEGRSPTLREITTGAGVNTKQLFTLFPRGPAKKIARVAGLGKPRGCV